MVRSLAAALCLLLVVQSQLQPAAARALRMRGGSRGRIVGGSDASISDYPWTLALLYAGLQDCGASVIGSQWALTAAHCFSYSDVRLFALRAGSSSRDSGGTVLDVAAIHTHQQHDATSGDYDIAVMRVFVVRTEPMTCKNMMYTGYSNANLVFRLSFAHTWIPSSGSENSNFGSFVFTEGSFPLGTNVAIVALPEDGYDPPAGLAVTVTGWGDTEQGDTAETLQKVDISVQERSACAGISPIGREVTPRMLCAGEAGRSVCFGNSGGPLVSGATQLGIVSWGSDRCLAAVAVYTNVGNLRSWVTEVTGV